MTRTIIAIMALLATTPAMADETLFPGSIYPAIMVNGTYFGTSSNSVNANNENTSWSTYTLTVQNYDASLVIHTYSAACGTNCDGGFQQGIETAAPQHYRFQNLRPNPSIMAAGSLSNYIFLYGYTEDGRFFNWSYMPNQPASSAALMHIADNSNKNLEIPLQKIK